MPQAVAAFASFVVATVGATGTAAAILTFAVEVAAIAAIGFVSTKILAKGQRNIAAGGQQVTARSTVEPMKIVYGEALVSGPIVYLNTSVVNPGDELLRALWYDIALCGHEVEDISEIWLDGDRIPSSSINWTTHAVTGGDYASYVLPYRYLGTDDQTAAAELIAAFPSDWTSAHRGRGIAHVVLRLETRSRSRTPFTSRGAPRNIRFLVQGKKIYDPRRDPSQASYSGSGAQTLGTQSTYEYSSNPALCTADYMIDTKLGMSIATSKIDWDTVAASADVCDELVDIPGPATEPRFTCNGVLFTDAEHGGNLESLLSSMGGRLSYTQGKFQIWAATYEAPTVTIDQDNIISDIEFQGSPDAQDKWNTVRATFVNPSDAHKVAQTAPRTDATYLSRDNDEELTLDIQLSFTNSWYMAQRIADYSLNRGDQEQIISFDMNMFGWEVAVGDRVNLNVEEYGWSPKIFRCIDWTWITEEEGEDRIKVVLIEDSSTAYVDPLVGDYDTESSSGTITFGQQSVEAPTGVVVSAVGGGIHLSWTSPQNAQFYDFIRIYASATNDFGAAAVVFEGDVDNWTHELAAGTTQFYWLYAVRNDGLESTREPNSATTTYTGTALAPGAGADGYGVSITADTLQWSVASDNTPTPAGLVSNIVATFRQGGSVLGTRTATMTLDASARTITGVDGGSTGSGTSAPSFSGNGTPSVSVTFTHSAAGSQTVTITVAGFGPAGADGLNAARTMALGLNLSRSGGANQGEGAIYGVNADGTADLTSTVPATFLWNGAVITVPHIDGASSFATGVAARRGFICVNTALPGDSFFVNGADEDIAFVFRDGAGWAYDNNTSAVAFTPTEDYVAIGWIETGAADDIVGGGIFGEAVTLTLAPTEGAQAGTNIFNEAGDILSDINIRNDQLVVARLGAENENPTFEIPRVGPTGLPAPASWFGYGSAQAASYVGGVPGAIRISGGAGLQYSNTAFPIEPGTEYEIVTLARKTEVADTTQLVVAAREINSELTTGQRTITTTSGQSGADPASLMAFQDQAVGLTDPSPAYATSINWDLTTTYEVYVGTYVPTPGARWASIVIDAANNAGATGDMEVEWCILRNKATLGAQAGTNIYNEAGDILSDIDLRNDQLVTNSLASLNFNPSFELPRRRNSGPTNGLGELVPAGWYLYATATNGLQYEGSARDEIQIAGPTGAVISNSAIRAETGTTYEFVALVKARSGTLTCDMRAREYNSDALPTGKRAIGSTTTLPEDEIQDEDSNTVVDQTTSIGTSYTLVSGTYTPGASVKWFSMSLGATSDTDDMLVEWAIVRDTATRNTGALADQDTVDTGDINDNAVTNSYSYTDGSHTTSGLSDRIATLTISAQPEAYVAKATFVCNGWENTRNIPTGPPAWDLVLGGVSPTVSQAIMASDGVETASPGRQYYLQKSWDVPVSTALTVYVDWTGAATGDIAEFANIELEVLQIKK